MNYSQLFAISAAGMDVERTRLDVAALNLANVNTVPGPGEAGYRPMKVVARQALTNATAFNQVFEKGMSQLPVATIEPSPKQVKVVFEPEHPMADKNGFVTYPAVDNATEMMTIMSAMRSYEANIAAMNAAKTMAMKALEIGGQS
jgi:flagellar basal-body rod protein FlgC